MNIEYSLDKLIMDIKVKNEVMSRLHDMFERGIVADTEKRQYYKRGLFKYGYSVKLDTDNSFWVGLMQNGETPNDHYTKCRIEFNPNKVAGHPVFEYIRSMMLSFCHTVEYKRFDVAIDIPLDRRDVFLQKDQRRYSCVMYSQADKTEYLGIRGNHGNVKLYNKQVESNLDYPLTRLEITMKYDQSSVTDFLAVFPVVRYVNSGQLSLDDMIMSDTDRYIVSKILDNPAEVNQLSRKTRKKIESIITRYSQILGPDAESYMSILTQILEYGKSKIGAVADYRKYVREKLSAPETKKPPKRGKWEFNPDDFEEFEEGLPWG